MSYLDERRAFIEAGRPLKEKKKYAIPKKSAKRLAKEGAEKDIRGDGDTELQKWYAKIMQDEPGKCWETGERIDKRDKMTDGFSESYSSGELAFTSFDKTLKQFTYKQQGNYIGYPDNITTTSSDKSLKKIHPTQKPVALYSWILHNYAKEGDKILDTHGGSMSSAIDCYNLNFNLVLCEIDSDYFKSGKKRFDNHCAQGQVRKIFNI